VADAYHGESAAWLNRLIAPLRVHGLDHILGVCWGLTWGGAGACAFYAAFAYLLRTPALARRLVPPCRLPRRERWAPSVPSCAASCS
jgi:hypothetical protein